MIHVNVLSQSDKVYAFFFSSMADQTHKDSENEIKIIFFAEASDSFLKNPSLEFGIACEDPHIPHPWRYHPGRIER